LPVAGRLPMYWCCVAMLGCCIIWDWGCCGWPGVLIAG
jgi:hypothetical protein